jgi:hypothetical protein
LFYLPAPDPVQSAGLPKRLSILRPVILLCLCLFFLALYVDATLRVLQLVPSMRYRTEDQYLVGVQRGLVLGHGPYSTMGLTPLRQSAYSIVHLRGIGWAFRIDRYPSPDESNMRLFWFVRIPHWVFAAFFALLAILSLRRHLKLQAMWNRLEKGLCPKCAYDLRASSEQCPECGTLIASKTPELATVQPSPPA